MSEETETQRRGVAEQLIKFASDLELAIVGIIAVVMEDEPADSEMQDIIHEVRTRAHRVRRIARQIGGGRR